MNLVLFETCCHNPNDLGLVCPHKICTFCCIPDATQTQSEYFWIFCLDLTARFSRFCRLPYSLEAGHYSKSLPHPAPQIKHYLLLRFNGTIWRLDSSLASTFIFVLVTRWLFRWRCTFLWTDFPQKENPINLATLPRGSVVKNWKPYEDSRYNF